MKAGRLPNWEAARLYCCLAYFFISAVAMLPGTWV